MGSGGSHSLWPPGKLFEVHEAATKNGSRLTRLQSGEFSASTLVAFTMDRSIGISPLVDQTT